MPKLTLAHSPDADDLVMWWPLVGLEGEGAAIETGGFEFGCVARDVEELNRCAIEGDSYDVTAISAAVYPRISSRYRITASGGSFGEGFGPKLVVRRGDEGGTRPGPMRVAVPGKNTTAMAVLALMLGARAFEATEMLFLDIPAAVADGRFDAGLLIHEAQLTFESAGLVAVADVGVWWGQETGLPLPLGLNVVSRGLDAQHGAGACEHVSAVLAASIRFAVEHAETSRRFLRARSADRPEWNDPALLDRYLEMYVSGLTLDMGDRGQRALAELYTRTHAAGLAPRAGELDVLPNGPRQSVG